jgi:acyl-CoA thioesterase
MSDIDADALARRVADTMLSKEGTGPSWGLVIEEAREGYSRVRMLLRPDMANGHGIVHGGMIFSLADSAFAYACNSRNATTKPLSPKRKSAPEKAAAAFMQCE